MDKQLLDEYINTISGEVENKIIASKEDKSKKAIEELVEKTVENYKNTLKALEGPDAIEDVKKEIKSNLKKKFSNKVTKNFYVNSSKDVDDVIKKVINNDIKVAAVDSSKIDLNLNDYINDKYNKKVMAEKSKITPFTFIYSSDIKANTVEAAIKLHDKYQQGREVFTKKVASNLSLNEHVYLGKILGKDEKEIFSHLKKMAKRMPFEKNAFSYIIDEIKDNLKNVHPDWSQEEIEEEARKILLRTRARQETEKAASLVGEDPMADQVGPRTFGMPLDDQPQDFQDVIPSGSDDVLNYEDAMGLSSAKCEKVKGFLIEGEENEIEFVFKDKVFDKESSSDVGSIVFNREEAKDIFGEKLDKCGTNEEVECTIGDPLVKVASKQIKLEASENVMPKNKVEAMSFDIDFVKPLQNWAKSKFHINLEKDAINIIVNELKDIYGELRTFYAYPKDVIENLVTKIIDNPNTYTLYSLASKIEKGDKVIITSLPDSPKGIVKEANEEKDEFRVSCGSVVNSFEDTYSSDELMKDERDSLFDDTEKISSEFEGIKKEIDFRDKIRKAITATLKNTDVSKIDFERVAKEKEKGWLSNAKKPDKLGMDDYTIGKEVEMKSGKKVKIEGRQGNKIKAKDSNGDEISMWISEIKRGER